LASGAADGLELKPAMPVYKAKVKTMEEDVMLDEALKQILQSIADELESDNRASRSEQAGSEEE
jgi:hypothetical protein